MEQVLREKDKKMKEMEERFQQQFEEEIQQIIKKNTATMEGTDERTIPKTRHRKTLLDKEPKTVHFDPEAKKEEGTARRQRELCHQTWSGTMGTNTYGVEQKNTVMGKNTRNSVQHPGMKVNQSQL